MWGSSCSVEMTVEMIWPPPQGGHKHVTAFQKFIGLAAIIGFSLAYARSDRMQKRCAPAFALLMVPILIYARISQSLAAVLLWPFKAVARLFRKSRPGGVTGPAAQ